MRLCKSFLAAALILLAIVSSATAARAGNAWTEPVLPNDNTTPAGRRDGDLVDIRLRAAAGQWKPEGPDGPALTVEAFGEHGAALTVPGPLIRVRDGATLAVTIANELPSPLRINGLCDRSGRECAPVDVAPGQTAQVRFPSGSPGTYHYWATTIGAPVPFRELAGAFIVDPRDGALEPDRVFIVTEWSSLRGDQLRAILSSDDSNAAFLAADPKIMFVINGLSWPATERLTYRRGETVRWRVINLSSQVHPFHLHGAFFDVLTEGDGRRDQTVGRGSGRRVVTQVLRPGGTMTLRWVPEHAGNWLFHCHVMHHVSPDRRLQSGETTATAPDHAHQHHHDDRSLGMAGMVLGIVITETTPAAPACTEGGPATRLVTMEISPGKDNDVVVALTEPGASGPSPRAASPGPVLVLRQDEPTEITVVNRLEVATSIHWHGLELESYYDGVHGWSGVGTHVAPMIAPGASFVVRITPRHAGTFIYHTHLHDYRQLSSGLYGALIVMPPGERYDPATDHAVVLGRRHATVASGVLEDASSMVVNGERSPRWTWSAGRRHRLRVINITPDDVLVVSLLARDTVTAWRPLMKDGAVLKTEDAKKTPARVTIAVGETYDFEYEAPPGSSRLWLETRSTSGKWQAQAQVVVK